MTKIAEITKQIKIPENVDVTIEDGKVNVKGEKGELTRTFSHPSVTIQREDNHVVVGTNLPRRKEKALMGTVVAHIQNMVKGVSEGFEYELKAVYSHFPIKTAVKDNEFVIQNFLGERSPRKAKILEGVNVEVQGDNIKVKGADKQKVGQTAANIEKTAMVKNRDIRVYQDGIYITNKE